MDVTTERATGKSLIQYERRRCKSGKAKPDETLRQKDPVPDKLWKTPFWDTDGVTPSGRVVAHQAAHIETTKANLSGHITEARELFRAPF